MFSAIIGVTVIIILVALVLNNNTRLELVEGEAFAQSINKVNTVWQNNYFELKKIIEQNNCGDNSKIRDLLNYSREKTGIDCTQSTITNNPNNITVNLVCEKTFPGEINKKNNIMISKTVTFNCTPVSSP